jgi:hypothetical protein
VNIEFKISVEFYDHAGFPMVSALGYFSAELYKQDPNTGNEVSVDFETMYLPADQLVIALAWPALTCCELARTGPARWQAWARRTSRQVALQAPRGGGDGLVRRAPDGAVPG